MKESVLEKIELLLPQISALVKEAAVILHEGRLFAVIYPDLQEAAERGIINIEEEIRWYAVELYNMYAAESEKLRGYKIVNNPLPKTEEGEVDRVRIPELLSAQERTCEAESGESDDEVCRNIKTYLHGVTAHTVHPSSHLELDLGLDSLDYIELFEFVQMSFGVHLDEKSFARMMVLDDLCRYVNDNKTKTGISKSGLGEILQQKCTQGLVHSPALMAAWKTFLLPLFRLWFRLKISGLGKLPESPFIIAPTHQSMLDGFIVESALPYAVVQKTFFLAYEPVFGRGMLRPLSVHGQNILIDANKGLKEAMLRCALPLKEGQNLVIFPEGARSRDGKLLEFRKFFAILSSELGVPVVPVVIDGTFEAMRAGQLFPRPAPVSITFLEPIYPAGLGYEEITARTRAAIEEEIGRNSI